MSTEEPIFLAQGLKKNYRNKQVVKDVSFSVNAGQVVGILGPNGAGKTTTFYILVGITKADGGRLILNGVDITSLAIHKRAKLGLSYLPQEASIFRKLNVEENIIAILELSEISNTRERAEQLMQDLGILNLRKSSAASLSGGERRRVEIARALATKPSIVLLDEPFAGVDPIAVIDIKGIIKFLTDLGISVVITDHNVRETLDICDYAYILNEGTVIASGKAGEIIQNDMVRRVYLGTHFRL